MKKNGVIDCDDAVFFMAGALRVSPVSCSILDPGLRRGPTIRDDGGVDINIRHPSEGWDPESRK
jgi:hypothetical protein